MSWRHKGCGCGVTHETTGPGRLVKMVRGKVVSESYEWSEKWTCEKCGNIPESEVVSSRGRQPIREQLVLFDD